MPRLKRRDFVEAAARTGGIQAQVMSAAELALWARADGLRREDVQNALWRDRTLIKTWAMRGTLHLLPADELPLYVAARGVHHNRNWSSYFAYYGLTPAQHEAFLAAVPEVLGARPMSRERLATALAERVRLPALRRLILSSGWGSPLKPSASRGDLCFGPSDGQKVTFVNPRKWIGGWHAIEPEEALREIARRYFRAYGPGTREGFARWWGLGLTAAGRLLRSLDSELERVEVEGERALALPSTVDAMRDLERPASVNLVPLFDAYTFGFGRHLDPLLPAKHESEVFLPQGWISAAVIVNGCIKGVWKHRVRQDEAEVRVRMFSQPPASVRKRIEAEAERLGAFLEAAVALAFS